MPTTINVLIHELNIQKIYCECFYIRLDMSEVPHKTSFTMLNIIDYESRSDKAAAIFDLNLDPAKDKYSETDR